MVLLNVVLKRTGRYARDRLESREHLRFFDFVVVKDPFCPRGYEELKVLGVLGRDVWSLEVDGVEPTQHSVVRPSHFIRDIVRRMIPLRIRQERVQHVHRMLTVSFVAGGVSVSDQGPSTHRVDEGGISAGREALCGAERESEYNPDGRAGQYRSS